jgi:hypothetical protein
VIPALLMIICYLFVIKELWTSTKVITILTTPSYNSNHIRVSERSSYLVRWPSKKLTSISINCQSCHSNSSDNTNSCNNSNNNNNCNNCDNIIFETNVNLNQHYCRSPVTDVKNARKQVKFFILDIFTSNTFRWPHVPNCADSPANEIQCPSQVWCGTHLCRILMFPKFPKYLKS